MQTNFNILLCICWICYCVQCLTMFVFPQLHLTEIFCVCRFHFLVQPFAYQHLLNMMVRTVMSGLLGLRLFPSTTLNLIWVTTVQGLHQPMSDFWRYQQYFLTLELTSALVIPKKKYWVNTLHFFNVFCLYFVTNVYYTLIRVVTSFIRFSEISCS